MKEGDGVKVRLGSHTAQSCNVTGFRFIQDKYLAFSNADFEGGAKSVAKGPKAWEFEQVLTEILSQALAAYFSHSLSFPRAQQFSYMKYLGKAWERMCKSLDPQCFLCVKMNSTQCHAKNPKFVLTWETVKYRIHTVNKVAFLPILTQSLQNVIKAKLLTAFTYRIISTGLHAEMTNNFHENYPVPVHWEFLFCFTF